MNSTINKKILKEYISEIIKEDDIFGGGGGGGGGAGVGNISSYAAAASGADGSNPNWSRSGGFAKWTGAGSGVDMYTAFVKPFANVIGVAVGKTKELARRSITVLQVAFETIMTTLLPFLVDSYDEIFDQEAQDIDKIKSEYSSYYEATSESLSGGATVFALIAFPGATLLGKFAEKGPQAAKSILSVATGGVSDKYLGENSNKNPTNIFDSYAKSYQELLFEAEKDNGDKIKKEKTLADKLGSKKFIDAMLNRSPTMLASSRDAQEIYKKTLNNALVQASQVLAANSISDVEKATGQKLASAKELEKVDPAERKKAEQELLKTVKKSAKEVYIARLESQVKPVAAAFGEDHPYVQGYRDVIRKIKAF